MRLGVIGLGYWGPNIIRNLLTFPQVIVIGCDSNKRILRKFSMIYPSIQTTESAQTLFEDKTLDAIVVATPPSTHYDLARLAINAHKHVLIEKPMTTKSSQAKKLISLAKKQKSILMVGHTFTYAEPVKIIKKILTRKQLGELYYFNSQRENLGIIQKDTNVVWDLASHDIAILDFLFSEKPVSISAFASSHVTKKQYEIANIFLNYKSGMVAHITSSWLSPVKIRTTYIAGSKKMIVYNDIEPSEKIRIFDKGVDVKNLKITPFTPLYRSGDILVPQIKQEEALRNELAHFLWCIRTNSTPITDGSCGLRVVQTLEAIDKAIKDGKKITLS